LKTHKPLPPVPTRLRHEPDGTQPSTTSIAASLTAAAATRQNRPETDTELREVQNHMGQAVSQGALGLRVHAVAHAPYTQQAHANATWIMVSNHCETPPRESSSLERLRELCTYTPHMNLSTRAVPVFKAYQADSPPFARRPFQRGATGAARVSTPQPLASSSRPGPAGSCLRRRRA